MSWTYEVEGKTTSKITNKIVRSVTVNNTEWFELVEYGERFWIRNTKLGQVEAINFFDSDDPKEGMPAEEALIFKYPAKAGDNWVVNEDQHVYFGQIEVSVPAGKYKCHLYQINMDSEHYSKLCIAENIGVVFNETNLEDTGKEISRLVSYSR